jgi:hypothetical protein
LKIDAKTMMTKLNGCDNKKVEILDENDVFDGGRGVQNSANDIKRHGL